MQQRRGRRCDPVTLVTDAHCRGRGRLARLISGAVTATPVVGEKQPIQSAACSGPAARGLTGVISVGGLSASGQASLSWLAEPLLPRRSCSQEPGLLLGLLTQTPRHTRWGLAWRPPRREAAEPGRKPRQLTQEQSTSTAKGRPACEEVVRALPFRGDPEAGRGVSSVSGSSRVRGKSRARPGGLVCIPEGGGVGVLGACVPVSHLQREHCGPGPRQSLLPEPSRRPAPLL